MSADSNAAIFLAALQGICANPNFFGPIFQQSPEAAVEFARSCVRAAYNGDCDKNYTGAVAAVTEQRKRFPDMQRWECYSDMIQGHLDGMKDALTSVPRSSNANRSHSYCLAYAESYASAVKRRAMPRDKVAEELAIKADMEG